MEVVFHEKYVKLSDMKAGDVATSKDRAKFFVCGYHYCLFKKANIKVIHDVNNLHDQYTEKRDLTQPVKILKAGDNFTCSQ